MRRFFRVDARRAWVRSGDAGNINCMAIESDENKPDEEEGATAGGMAEAVVQDVELIVDKVMDTAGDAVVIVQEKLGMRPASSRAKKPAKPKAKAPAAKPKPPIVAKATPSKGARAMPKKAAKVMPRKAVKAKARKVATSGKPAKPKSAVKSERASKGKKAKAKR